MNRFLLSTLAMLTVVCGVQAHFVFLITSEDQSSLKVVLSDGLDVDDGIDAAKIAGTKLFLRGPDGKDSPLTTKASAHHLDVALPGKGPRLVFGTTDYGVLQKGDAKPFQLKYHSKTIIGECTKANTKVGEALPVEIIPTLDGGKVRFQFLAKGKPVADVEMNMLLPADKKEKVKTDKEGFTQWFDAKGRYGAWSRHSETVSGETGGKKFEEIRHYATLVVDVAK